MEKLYYKVAELPLKKLTADELLKEEYRKEIKERISLIITEEAPIYKSLVKKRLLNSYGLKKCGTRIEKFLSPVFSDLENPFIKERGECLFLKEGTTFSDYRVSKEQIRYSYQIPFMEGANAIKAILEKNPDTSEADLINEFCKEFEYKRKGAQVVALFKGSLEYHNKTKKDNLNQSL